MTLIAVYGSDGCEGRCDARCYNATSPNCDCVCGGRNHGAGINKAQENTCEMAKELLDRADPEHEILINPRAFQPALFGENDG